MNLAIEIARASFNGVDARDARVRMHVDPDGLQLDRLAIGDIGGGSFTAAGRIETQGNVPRGSLVFDLDTAKAAAIAEIAERLAPGDAGPALRLLERVGRAKLHARLDLADVGNTSTTGAQLAVAGTFDDLRVDAHARLNGDWQKRTVSDIEANAAVDATSAPSLMKLVDLDDVVVPGNGPARLTVRLTGPARGDLTFDMQIAGEGLSAKFAGKGRTAGGRIEGNATMQVQEAYLRPLRPGPASAKARLPFKLSSRVVLSGGALSLDDIDARLDTSNIRGRLRIDDSSPRRVEGSLDADAANAGNLVALAVGLPRAAKSGPGWTWSSEPFGPGLFGKVAGEVAFRSGRAEFLPNISGRDFRGTLRFGEDRFALDGTGELGGGRLACSIAFHRTQDGLSAQTKVSLTGADASTLFPAAARPMVTGSLNFTIEGEGSGLSAVALVGSAKGSGTISLTQGRLASLDPRTFDAVTHAVDHGLAIEQGRIADVVRKSIISGQLPIRRAESALTVSAGQIRLSKPTVDSERAELTVSGALDLIDGSVDARLVLSGQAEAAGARPDIFMALKGALPDVSNTMDVSALTGWLTLRAIEIQTKQLRAIEQPQSRSSARPKINQAPPLPAPTDIKPAPKPRSAGQPAASVGTHY
jgi:hypothetical protein